jgi:hypothetical protein
VLAEKASTLQSLQLKDVQDAVPAESKEEAHT